ncbi:MULTISPECIES: SulP family inorganic anion transporter [Kitasatospora]|uniref:Putative transporter n=1 Tax=Kitasatospora setae (strain ATCC 33774 / DSM 43861 / JCM 3304 / KCC A-0304 / NBRC 14216 / KM-6054) TaxID=452652 RepID=E4N5W6_KITSK|nr:MULTISPECIES: SulP family inorganic anion transporter [Kitasatospora]BAJ26597.1 putative transporter [Kitasatospora setae KM-6054]
MPWNTTRVRAALRTDLPASITVFLVAVPLCVGVSVASGAPAELGLVTGIVGGLVAGALPGSSLQVSGPAAGLTVLVHSAVTTHGLPALGVIVLTAGLLQVLLGLLRLGRCFRAVSSAVVEGMLSGIGLVLIASQAYVLLAGRAHGDALADLAGLPATALRAVRTGAGGTSLAVGAGVIAVLALWKRAPRRLAALPGPLVAVVLAAAAVRLLRLPVPTVGVGGLLGALRPPGVEQLGLLARAGIWGTVLAFALIASAESLFSASAVDHMHAGPRTHYNRELIAQGIGNTVAGALGALPMTAVIVRSAANVQAGARTKASRILHGGWLLLFTLALPGLLELVPLAALAGLLLHAGAKLAAPRERLRLWRADRSEALVLAATTVGIVTTNLLEGVVIGLVAALAKTAWDVTHIRLHVEQTPAATLVRVHGNATFLKLPTLVDRLEEVTPTGPVELDLSALTHLDAACRQALTAWAERHRRLGLLVNVTPARTKSELAKAN